MKFVRLPHEMRSFKNLAFVSRMTDKSPLDSAAFLVFSLTIFVINLLLLTSTVSRLFQCGADISVSMGDNDMSVLIP